MARTAINLYSVRGLDEPLLRVLDRVADAGYDGVQLSGGLGDASVTEVEKKLTETGLTATAAHVDIEALEEDIETVAATYTDLGCDGVVVPYLDESHFESAAAVDETADRLSALAARLADRGLTLHYHNHAHEFELPHASERGKSNAEFVDGDGEPALDRLLAAAPDLRLELDVGWAAVAGADPVAVIERFGGRIDLLHAKDVALDPWAFSEIGEGDVAMDDCIATATETGVDWLVYEHDEPEDPAASIERGSAYLEMRQ